MFQEERSAGGEIVPDLDREGFEPGDVCVGGDRTETGRLVIFALAGIGWRGHTDIDAPAVEEARNGRGVARVAADQPVVAEFPEIARLGDRDARQRGNVLGVVSIGCELFHRAGLGQERVEPKVGEDRGVRRLDLGQQVLEFIRERARDRRVVERDVERLFVRLVQIHDHDLRLADLLPAQHLEPLVAAYDEA